MPQKRKLYRIPIHRDASVRRGSETGRGELIELTEMGVRVRTALAICIGEQIDLEFDLTDSCRIHCTVTIAHASPPEYGGFLSGISKDHQVAISRFIDQQIAMNLTGF